MKLRHIAMLGLGMAFSSQLLAQEPNEAPKPDVVVQAQGFLVYHPDIDFRGKGLRAFQDGFLGDAVTYFTKAARYADKASQAMIGEMHWNGTGVPQDRALAYAWMDLAAERLYPAFLANRERYWQALSEAERERAIEVGLPLYEDYGDDVAKPRLERELRRGQRNITGSRVGLVGALEIRIAGPGGEPISISGDQYYADKYWRAERYWEWTDEIWSAPPKGRVDVGELQRLSEEVDHDR